MEEEHIFTGWGTHQPPRVPPELLAVYGAVERALRRSRRRRSLLCAPCRHPHVMVLRTQLRVLGGRRPRSCAEASAPGGPYTLAMPNTFSPASCQLLPQRPSPHTAVEVERLYEGLYGVHPTLMGHAAAV